MKYIILLLAFYIWAISANAQISPDSIGVYSVYDDVIKPINVINYNGLKISKGFMSAKAKLEFAGATSPNRFKGRARFRIYFGQPTSYELASLYMFSPSYKINDFGIGQFEVKKDNRFLTTAEAALFGNTSSGAKSSENITIEVVELRPNVYEVTVTGKPGEYCIMHTFRGSAGYGGGI